MFPPSADSQTPSNATSDLVRDGVVLSVDLPAARAVVDLGDGLITGPIPWTAVRAGALRIWSPPSAGEQVQVLAPEGDFERARICGSLFCDAKAPPAADGSTRLQWDDGTFVSYAGGQLEVHVVSEVKVSAEKVEVVAPNVEFTGDIKITGDVELVGKLEATGDVKADTISLKDHVHTQVAAGTGQSGKPKP